MDDQSLIARSVPEGWQVEPFEGWSGLWVLSSGNHGGFVTLDFKKRAFALGMCHPRLKVTDPVFAGRKWKVELISAAVTALQVATS
jgi:hypothetical protein